MEIKKIGRVDEIVNADNSLIGRERIPTHGTDRESDAPKTTDYNANISRQPFRYDMLGRFGFTLFPFFEGKEDDAQNEVISELQEFFNEKHIETLKMYYKNPSKLKNHYRVASRENFDKLPDEIEERCKNMAIGVMELIQPHIEKALEGVEKSIDEGVVFEDTIMKEKKKKWIENKTDDNELNDKEIKKIAGLLNKMKKDDLKDLINLLETK